ncbi:ATP-binding cassette domain-containing protein [bacterium]|nr:ATP-binding cassette domain-containing protein [bacterium]
MISVRNVTKRFGQLTAVNNVSFEVKQGEIVGFLGPNGAGKTTTMRMITGYFQPDAGSIFVDGIDVALNPLKSKALLGYLPENSPMYEDMTVKEFLSFIMDIREVEQRKQRLDYVIAAAGLESVFNRFIWELSKGFHQRVGIAQALISDPRFLVLDEPTAGLDPNQILEIRALIKELGKEKTIILSTHILQEAEALAEKILIIDNSKLIAQGSKEELKGKLLSSNSTKAVLRKDDNFSKKIGEMKGVSEVKTRSLDEYTEYMIFSKGDVSEEVFELAAKTGAVLKELTAESVSLEDIFVKLTSKGEKK